MSALPPIADIRRCRWDVRKVPGSDIRQAQGISGEAGAMIVQIVSRWSPASGRQIEIASW
jgi:hypothetical protein